MDTLCVAVLAEEAEEGAGLGFDLERAWDSGRSVVAAVRDVTVDLALECPRCRSLGAVVEEETPPDDFGLAAVLAIRLVAVEDADMDVDVDVDWACRTDGALPSGFVVPAAPCSVGLDGTRAVEPPETCLEVKPVCALVRDVVVVVAVAAVVVVAALVGGFMGSRLGDMFLDPLRL